jgi:hypothetical protein
VLKQTGELPRDGKAGQAAKLLLEAAAILGIRAATISFERQFDRIVEGGWITYGPNDDVVITIAGKLPR